MRILVVEDEPKVAAALRQGLASEGYDVVLARTGEEGFFELSTGAFDLVLLDRMLPGRDGIEILRVLRRRGGTVPVLLLTAKDAIEDRVTGLDAGADDYLVKPFAFAELLARIRVLTRRGPRAEVVRLEAADLVMDLVARRVTRGGRAIDLTVREFELLEHLLRHAGEVVSRETLAREVWDVTARATSIDNVIDVHVARLRKKVDADADVRLIETVRGVGFVVRERS